MGGRYSTIYTHNTYAGVESNKLIDTIATKIGLENCTILKKYPFHTKCKMCYISMYETQVLMLKCYPLKHRYHTKCITKNAQHFELTHIFKCWKCRDLLKKAS